MFQHSKRWLLTDLGNEHFLFLTTHYLEEAEEVADSIGILDDGRLVALGSMDDLRRQLKHQYSLRVSEGVSVQTVEGEIVSRGEGQMQIMTTKAEALSISKRLIEQNAQFSINPVTLDDIFYYAVAKGEPVGRERGEG